MGASTPRANPVPPRLVSYDVFDTVITRRVGRPDGVFQILGRELAAESLGIPSAEVFATQRRQAEARARGRAPQGEATLADIWKELEWYFGWKAGSGGELAARELALERALIAEVPGVRDELQAWRSKGVIVRFVSDTYFDATSVAGLLSEARVQSLPGECWTSSDAGCSKKNGALFTLMLADARVAAGDAVHHGNDARIDVIGARQAGVRGEWRPAANLTPHEERLDGLRSEADGIAPLLAGASRLARLEVMRRRPTNKTRLVEIATAIVAPVLTAYVLWVLKDAADRGLTRLYFVSRDGQVLRALAAELAGRLAPTLDLRYLYGGRLAWVLPAFDQPGAALDWLFDQADTGDVRSCLGFMNIGASRADAILQSAGVLESGERSSEAKARLKALVERDPAVREEITQALAGLRASTLAYLAQEGVDDASTRSGFVDIGWKGSLYRSLETLIGPAQPECAYHFGLMGGIDSPAIRRIRPYLFDLVNGLGYCDLGRRAALMVETFCAGSEGVAVSYVQHGGRWQPRFVDDRDEAAVAWGVELVHDAVIEFGRQLAASPIVTGVEDLRAVAAAVLERFWDRPDELDAIAWGSFPIANGPRGRFYKTFAEPYRAKDLVRAMRTGQLDLTHICAWPAGSVELTPRATRTAMDIGLRSRARLAGMRKRLARIAGKGSTPS